MYTERVLWSDGGNNVVHTADEMDRSHSGSKFDNRPESRPADAVTKIDANLVRFGTSEGGATPATQKKAETAMEHSNAAHTMHSHD